MGHPENVIILGHSGFIGTHLSGYLANDCAMNVIGKSLPSVDLSIDNNFDSLAKYFTENSVLVILSAVKRQFGDSLSVYMQNMEIIKNIAAMIERQPIHRILYFSSAAVYGEETENTNISENTEVNPTSYYGISKFSSECVLRKVCNDNQLTSLVCLRPPLIYGLGDLGNTYGPSGFSEAARNNQQITLWGDGTELREFIYIRDLCHIVETLISLDEVPSKLNIASGQSYCFKDILDILGRYYPSLDIDTKKRSKEKVDNAFNPEKLLGIMRKDFKFTSLQDGIAEILNAK
jgi:UDP-glucose 4-epimerase